MRYAARVIADQTRIWPANGVRDWTFKRSLAGGGHLVWLGIHWIDLMTFITESPVVEVQAMTDVVGGAPIDVEDLALVNLRFANGAYGSLVSGYLLDKPYQLDLSLWGSDGWLRFGASDRHLLEWHSASPDPGGVPDRRIAYSGPDFANYTPWIERTLRACLGSPAPITGAEALAALRVVHRRLRVGRQWADGSALGVLPPARADARGAGSRIDRRHARLVVGGPLVAVAAQLAHLRRQARQDFVRPRFQVLDGRSAPGRAVGQRDHLARPVASVRAVGVKQRQVDDHRRAGRRGDDDFIRMRGIALVGVGVRVHGQVRPWNHPQRRNVRRQVVQVVQHPHLPAAR